MMLKYVTIACLGLAPIAGHAATVELDEVGSNSVGAGDDLYFSKTVTDSGSLSVSITVDATADLTLSSAAVTLEFTGTFPNFMSSISYMGTDYAAALMSSSGVSRTFSYGDIDVMSGDSFTLTFSSDMITGDAAQVVFQAMTESGSNENEMPNVPLPAGGALLAMGLAAFGAARRWG